nr:threonine synthase-like 2 [Procambarus clarkii]XP_045614566.1 threonine synthase-like 2 [Procambarus clarkii]XP_045614567.1 threonine synthase-like 2 [Procambarus clarkii]XP_045614568.1 threonine synthase-like 2 [Procambarus clarkii]XP_045614570.1 threonine synthase-like 2 [Procambarus clarkii]
MKYCSTRGRQTGLSFQDVLFSGYAEDGGLYMPETIPELSQTDLNKWCSYSYPELVYAIARRFIDEQEISNKDLADVINGSFTRFRIPEIIRIEYLPEGLNIVELFHGPTLAFKDLPLSVVGRLLNYYLSKSGKHSTILVGTSGDTGSAAIESVRGQEHMDIIVLLPHGRCTPIQELQMTTVVERNVHVFCVEGTSDDLDKPIKQCFADKELVSTHNLISINSINWGRILVQVAHYFYIYYQLCGSVGNSVNVVVPTGAAGNLTAGCIAQKMGLPITLAAGVNVNDSVARVIKKADFSLKEEVLQTLAPAMDIQVPYNVERLVYLYANGDTTRVKEVMDTFEKNNSVDLPQDIMEAMRTAIVESFIVDDGKITETMQRIHEEHRYIVCPHTAVAAAYHYQWKRDVPHGYVATASPAKFPDAVQKAKAEPVTEGIKHLKDLPKEFQWMRKGQDWHTILRAKIEAICVQKKNI